MARPAPGRHRWCYDRWSVAQTTAHMPSLGEAAELGAIGDDRVRVWVRWPGAPRLSGSLAVEGRAPVGATVELSPASDWTGALELTLPQPAPGAAFRCRVGDRELRGRLAPAPGSAASLRFGFGSCNTPFGGAADGEPQPSHHAFYAQARAELEQAGCSHLFLLGDQIYADGSIGGVQELGPDDDALARYRAIYRLFFAHPGYRALRERFATLCTWDDHEILDDWGALRDYSDQEQRLFRAACRAYCEYQHSRNPGGALAEPPYHFTGVHGDVGLLGLDTRGARDPAGGSMLGEAQWEAVQAFLAGPAAAQVSTLVVLSSVPIAHVSRWFTATFDRFPERFASPVLDRWCSSHFVASRDALLDALFAWQSAEPRRQVLILSGDVHAASAFSIRQARGDGILHQVTSSAMTTPLSPKQVLLNRLVVRAPNLFEDRYRFRRHFLSVTNNVGVARLEPAPGGGHRIAVTIRAWDPDEGAFHTRGELELSPAAATRSRSRGVSS